MGKPHLWLLGALATQSFRLPIPGLEQAGVSLLLGLCCAIASLGRARIRRTVVPALLLAAAALVIGLGGPDGASTPSALFLVALLLLTCVDLRADATQVWRMMWLAGMGVAAVCVLQMAGQGLGFGFTSVHTILPDLVLSDYNSISPISYGSEYIRSNGFVLLEPANASQVIALGYVAGDLLGLNSWKKRLLLLGGVASTLAGTGLFLIAVWMILGLFRRAQIHAHSFATPKRILGLGFLALVILGIGSSSGRISEYGNDASSFSFRFVAPYQILYREVLNGTSLLGVGAGNIESLLLGVGDATLFPVMPKLVIEYGLPIGIVGSVLIFLNTSAAWAPGTRIVGFLFVFVLNGGPLNPATIVPAWIIGCAVFGRSNSVLLLPPSDRVKGSRSSAYLPLTGDSVPYRSKWPSGTSS